MIPMTRLPLVSALSAVAVLLAACGSTTDLSENQVPVESRQTTADANADASATPQSQVATVDLSPRDAAAAAAARNRVVYFDFDSFVVKPEFQNVVDANARLLTIDRQHRLVVEGHTDERGGREYNLALGQKRAEAVVKSMTLLGASEQQLEAVSFGKERPADSGQGEQAWAKNRRAELKDR